MTGPRARREIHDAWRRRSASLLVIVALSSCARSPSKNDGPTSSTIATDASLPTETLRCEDAIDALDRPPPEYTTVLDVVALAGVSSQSAPLQTSEHDGRLFAKSGLLVRSGATFELVVPRPSSLRLRFRPHAEPTVRLRVPGCSGRRDWLAFAGGFTVAEHGCMDLLVRDGAREAVVRIGLGVACSDRR